MFARSTLSVWIGILALSGMFLLGQDTWTDSCVDYDGDGYGDPASAECLQPALDCDDTNPDVYPGAPEVCDAADNQCPGEAGYGLVDEGFPMACIPAGCFAMGDPFNDGQPDELPVHNVCISAFEMDFFEVTNAQYAECVDDSGCTPPMYSDSYSRSTYYGDPAYGDYPVIWVDWYDADAYCTWAGGRLPTEAEWEYAARGGLAGSRYPRGDAISGAEANHWLSGDPEDNDTNAVGTYPANGYGLYDMAGNVWEWVDDWYGATYYSTSPPGDPAGPESGTYRVLRGGSWDTAAQSLRVANRYHGNPAHANSPFGFRCAR